MTQLLIKSYMMSIQTQNNVKKIEAFSKCSEKATNSEDFCENYFDWSNDFPLFT